MRMLYPTAGRRTPEEFAAADPAGKSIVYGYDPDTGDLKTVTDRTANTTTYRYANNSGQAPI